jgi:hypothetical protein
VVVLNGLEFQAPLNTAGTSQDNIMQDLWVLVSPGNQAASLQLNVTALPTAGSWTLIVEGANYNSITSL